MKKTWISSCCVMLSLAGHLQAQMMFNDGLEIYIGTGLTVNMSGNLVNNGTILNLGTVKAHHITNQPDALLDGAGTFAVNGNWLNYGDLLFEGTVSFEGKGAAFLQTNGIGLNKVRLAKTGLAPTVELLDDLRVVEELDFASPNNKLKISNLNLEIEPTAVLKSANHTRYIVTNGTGMVTRRLMPTGIYFTFPVGATETTYNPVDIRNTGVLDDISVRCLPLVLSDGGTGTPVEHDAVAASWHIAEGTAGGVHLTIYPQWSGTDEYGSFSRSYCAVRRFNGTTWDFPFHGPATGGNPFKRGRGNIFQTGYFAVFDSEINADPPSTEDRTIGPKLKIKASPNPFADHFRLEKIAAPALESRVVLQSVAGQVLRSMTWPSDAEVLDLDGSLLPAGVYFVSVDFGKGGRSVLPVVKQ